MPYKFPANWSLLSTRLLCEEGLSHFLSNEGFLESTWSWRYGKKHFGIGARSPGTEPGSSEVSHWGRVTLTRCYPRQKLLSLERKSPGSERAPPAGRKTAGTLTQQMVSLACCVGAKTGIWAKNVRTSGLLPPPEDLLKGMVRDSLWNCPFSLPGLCTQIPSLIPSSVFFFFTITFLVCYFSWW